MAAEFYLISSIETTEGLPIVYVLPVTSRVLFALNLLPALQRATSLRRVVSVFAAGFEGQFNDQDWAEYGVKKPLKARGHIASMITMANNVLARRAPDVTFIHNFPGSVRTPFGKDATGTMAVVRAVFNGLGRVLVHYLPPDDCGTLQLFGATSARFPPAAGTPAGVPLPQGVDVARGSDDTLGSGSYNINYDNETVSADIARHLARAKADGAEEKVWEHLIGEIKRITGKTF